MLYEMRISTPTKWYMGSSCSTSLECMMDIIKVHPRDKLVKFILITVKHVACLRCSNYIFILDSTPRFNGLG